MGTDEHLGQCAYDLALVNAQLNKSEACREHLYTALVEGTLLPIATVQNERKLSSMHQESWYEPFVKRAREMQNRPSFVPDTNPFSPKELAQPVVNPFFTGVK